MWHKMIKKPMRGAFLCLTQTTGSLIVFVLDAGGALPVTGARVRIYHSGDMGGEPIAELISGENGKTEAIYLPTPPVSISDIPDRSPGVFELYDIVVSLDGYFDVVSRKEAHLCGIQ